MNWYYTFVDILLLAFTIVMARHTWLRAKFYLHIFQQKGYTFNEYWQWIVKNWNRRVVTLEHVLFVLIIFVMLRFMSDTVTGSAAIIILTLFGFFWFGPFTYYRGEKEKKPLAFTPRLIRLAVPFVICCFAFPVFASVAAFIGRVPFTDIPLKSTSLFPADIYLLAFGWIFGNVLVPFWIFLAGLLTRPIENRIHQHFIHLAKQKLGRMPALKIIAITGSYGKTSTKFMIRDLLKERMGVCSTPGSYNTPMGICKVINDDLEAHHQVLILEMGARYEGNIDELCDIAQPDVAVITNVGVAHLETFGSQEAIARTKSTLVKRLNPGGTAVLNADDPLVADMAGLRSDITVVKTGLSNGTVRAGGIGYDHEGTRFTASVEDNEHGQDKDEPFKTRLLGVHNVQNMLLAIAVGRIFDLRLKTMSIAARNIEPIEHRLELKKQGELYIIDDAFNSNPVGAKNAVEILAWFNSGRRIIVTPGMIELGDIQEEKNRDFGESIGKADLDLVILVGAKQTEPIREGVISTGFEPEKIKVVGSLFKANDIIREYARAGDVILYENDLPDTYNE